MSDGQKMLLIVGAIVLAVVIYGCHEERRKNIERAETEEFNRRSLHYSPSFGGAHEWYCSDCNGQCSASTRYDFKNGECQKCYHPAGHHH